MVVVVLGYVVNETNGSNMLYCSHITFTKKTLAPCHWMPMNHHSGLVFRPRLPEITSIRGHAFIDDFVFHD